MCIRDRHQNDQSNAPSETSSKAGDNHNLSLRMKLTDWSQNVKSKALSSMCKNKYDLLLNMKLDRRKQSYLVIIDKSNASSSKSRNNHHLLLKMKLGQRLQNDKSSAPSSKSGNKDNLWLRMKLKDWPQNWHNHDFSVRLKLKDRLQNSKSNAPSSKSGSNHNFSLTTGPMPHHPSPETIIIFD